MKTRILSVVALMLITLSISAQSIGIQAGYVNVDNVFKNSNNVYNGFQVGAVTESNLIGGLDLHYGVLYNFLVESKENTVLGVTTKTSYTGHLVDVPVQAQYGLPIGPLKVFAFAGPTLNFSIDQRTKTSVGSSETVVNHHDIDLNNDDKKDLSRFDVKLGVGAGVSYSSLELRVGYDWGMLDLNSLDNVTHHRNQLTAAVVYKF